MWQHAILQYTLHANTGNYGRKKCVKAVSATCSKANVLGGAHASIHSRVLMSSHSHVADAWGAGVNTREGHYALCQFSIASRETRILSPRLAGKGIRRARRPFSSQKAKGIKERDRWRPPLSGAPTSNLSERIYVLQPEEDLPLQAWHHYQHSLGLWQVTWPPESPVQTTKMKRAIFPQWTACLFGSSSR